MTGATDGGAGGSDAAGGGLGLIGRKAARGAVALAARQVLVQAIGLGAAVVLARLFDPAFFGAYAIVSSLTQALATLSDVGLAVSLIRQKEPPTEGELGQVFTFQVALAGGLGLLLGAGGVLAAEAGRIGSIELVLGLAVLAAGVLGALRAVPLALLERDLAFDRLARIEVVDAAVFQGTIVASALLGLGLGSLAVGLVARAVVDLAQVYAARPWRPRPSRDLAGFVAGLRARLGYGLRFQAVGWLSLGKDQLWPLLLTALAGAASTGYFSVALRYAALPAVAFHLLVRVLFPAFFRLQHDRPALVTSTRAVALLVLVLGLPVVALLCGLAAPGLGLLFGPGWDAAVAAVQVLAVHAACGLVTTLTFTLLYVVGEEAWALKVFAAWTAAQVGLLVVGVRLLPLAAPTAAAVVTTAVTVPVAWLTLRRVERALGTRLLGLAAVPAALAAAAAVLVGALVASGQRPVLYLPVAVAALGVELAVTLWLERRELGAAWRLVAAGPRATPGG